MSIFRATLELLLGRIVASKFVLPASREVQTRLNQAYVFLGAEQCEEVDVGSRNVCSLNAARLKKCSFECPPVAIAHLDMRHDKWASSH